MHTVTTRLAPDVARLSASASTTKRLVIVRPSDPSTAALPNRTRTGNARSVKAIVARTHNAEPRRVVMAEVRTHNGPGWPVPLDQIATTERRAPHWVGAML